MASQFGSGVGAPVHQRSENFSASLIGDQCAEGGDAGCGHASNVDPKRFGVKGFYLFGSVKNAQSGPSSDIDILIHFIGTEEQRKDLNLWLEGWSLSLSQINFLRTGNKTDGLLDVHIITDEDIKKRDSYAIKIGAVSDAARPLPVGTAIKKA